MRLTALLFLVAFLLAVHVPKPAYAQEDDEDESDPEGQTPEDHGEEDAEEMLKMMDTDADLKLTVEELMAGIRKLADEDGEGHDQLEEHEATIKRLFPKNDRDGDGHDQLEEHEATIR